MDDVEEERRLIRAAHAIRRQRRQLDQAPASQADVEAWQEALAAFRKALDDYRQR